MHLLHNKKQITLAAFLLCLLGIFTISPVDYFCRQLGNRNRAIRTVRLDDHDLQDYALDVVGLMSDCHRDGNSDGGKAAVLNDADSSNSSGPEQVLVLIDVPRRVSSEHFGLAQPRAPPSSRS